MHYMRGVERMTLGRAFLVSLRDGGSIALIQTLVAAIVWNRLGRPDFWFRGGFSPGHHLPMAIFGFGLLSLPYGILLWFSLRVLGRTINSLVHSACATALAIFVSPFYVSYCFISREIDFPGLVFYSMLGTSGLLSMIVGKRVSVEPHSAPTAID